MSKAIDNWHQLRYHLSMNFTKEQLELLYDLAHEAHFDMIESRYPDFDYDIDDLSELNDAQVNAERAVLESLRAFIDSM